MFYPRIFSLFLLLSLTLVNSFHLPSVHSDLATRGHLSASPLDPFSDEISGCLIATNNFFKGLTISPIRNFLERDLQTSPSKPFYTPLETITSPPSTPLIPRPTWLVILASLPTGLIWYGYYKFSIEEELFNMELNETGKVSGAGGYGTLIAFSFSFLICLCLRPINEDISTFFFLAGNVWILGSQVNLYHRINELYESKNLPPPLHAWWALLPPPIDVIVGLRQVHFLAKYAANERGLVWERDLVADWMFPWISSERFTLKEFVREPRRWFFFTGKIKDFEF
ncbi:hypothetical protein TrLO_g10497 [Triparma laevis f. longispina]|uniref:Uncharacterized protein n=1 Tax=Triparma laevis f. longispina TaxID=1714387 RepID=A0A9W7KY05_9STRA|nr:hypothetical protein TrLO_g10497 [Triparma laevis f. longispina]